MRTSSSPHSTSLKKWQGQLGMHSNGQSLLNLLHIRRAYHQNQHLLKYLQRSRRLRFSLSKCPCRNRFYKKERRCSNERLKSRTALLNKFLNKCNSLMWMRTVNLSPLVSLSIKCGATGGKWKVCRSYHVLELEIVRTNETGSLD